MSFKSESKKRSRFEATVEDESGATRRAARDAPDLNRCPSGWNQDIWHLVLVFEQKAQEDQIVLAHGRPLLYSKLKQALETSGLMDMECPWTNTRLQLQFDFIKWCWWMGERPHMMHEVQVWPLAGPKWRRVVELMLVEFWNYFTDEYAMDEFTEINGRHGFKWQLDKLNSRMVTPVFAESYRREVARIKAERVGSPVGGVR